MNDKVWVLWFQAPSSDIICFSATQLISCHKTKELAEIAKRKSRIGHGQGSLRITELKVE